MELNEIDAFANDPVQRNKLLDFIVNGLSDSPDANDLAQAAQLHVVIAFAGNLFALNEAGGFDLWNGKIETLPSADSKAALGSQVNISVVSGLSQLTGTFDIFVRYTLGDGVLKFNASAFHFVVE